MKRLLVAGFSILLLSFTTEWTTVKLNESAEVSLPGTPVEEIKNGISFKKLVLADSTKFNTGAIDLTQMGLTESQVKEMAPGQEFKDQFKQGLEMQGVKILNEEYGDYNGNTFYEYLVERNSDGKKSTSVIRSVFYKKYLIQLTYMPGIKGEDVETKKKFFTSLKLS